VEVSKRLETYDLDVWIAEFSLTEGARLARMLYTTVAGI
jgi:hypothetical protein